MTKLNKALMATTAIAFTSGLALPASAQDPSAAPGVVKSRKTVKLSLYGQITRQFGLVGDGETVTAKTGPNGNTSTRMGIDGRGKITKDISLRTRMEFAVQSGEGGGGDQFDNQSGSNDFDIRHTDVILSHKRFGAVWIGRGDSATNGTSEVQLAPGMHTGRLGGGVANVPGEYILLGGDCGTVEPCAVRTVASFFNNMDGMSRQNRIRYDSPTLFGLKASVGWVDKHNVNAALRYGGKFAGTRVKAAVAWCHSKGSNGAGTGGTGACFGNGTTIEGISQVNGSVSVLTPVGIGATFAGGRQWLNRAGAGHATLGDPVNLNPSIWYTTKVTELGATSIEYAFQYSRDVTLDGDKGRGHALTLLQKVDSVSGDYFLGFRYIDAETATNDNIDGLWWVGGGFRQRF